MSLPVNERREEILKPRRVAVLINASSGKDNGGSDSCRKALEAAFSHHGIIADIEFLPGAQLRAGAERALRKAAEGRLDAVVGGGGDGTIRSVASALVDTGVPLGIIPSGTFNHFAKDLKIPLSVDGAVALIASGELLSIDVGEANGEIFVNNSSIGVYPYLVIDRERRRKNGLPKWFAMAWALLRAFRYFPVRRLSIRAEDWAETVRSPCVFIGNNEYRLTGPSAGTREKLDAGQLSLLVAKHQNMVSLFLLAGRSVIGLLDRTQDLRVVTLVSVDIASRRRKLLVAFDGEVETMRSPLHYKIRPKALQVFTASTPDAP